MAETIAAFVVKALIQAGVRRIHGLTGDSLNGIIDEVRKSDGKIEFIHYRHEEAAAFAAGAEAQLTGRLAVCCGSCGPGNLHLINGLFDAHRSQAPVLAIAAHIPSTEIGTGYFQETHPDRLFQECSHYCELIAQPAQTPRVLQAAMQHAISLRGVAVVALSGDVAMEAVDDTYLSHPVFYTDSLYRPAESGIIELVQRLNGARKVAILAGAGCRDAREEVLQLCQTLQAPLVTALRGKEILQPDNPYFVGLTGLLGFPPAHHALQEAEVLLCLGTDFPYKEWYPKDAQIIQVELRPERLGRRCKLDLGLAGSVKDTLQAVQPLLEPKKDDTYLRQYREDYERFRKHNDPTVEDGQGTLIHPQFLAHALAEAAPADTVFTADVGTPTVWAARNINLKLGQRLLGSLVHGSMASAMPQAIGAALARPDAAVVALCGDGGFAMLMGEILTIAQYRLPIKIVIFNNGSLGFVETEMKVAGLVPYGVELKNPDFARLAEACGILGILVEDKHTLEADVARAFAHPGPVLLDVLVNPKELSFPPEITLKQAVGFSLYMLHETANGNPQEVWDTLKTNFLS